MGAEDEGEAEGGIMNEKPQEARNATVNLEFVSGEAAIQTLTDMFGADEVIRIAREQAKQGRTPASFYSGFVNTDTYGTFVKRVSTGEVLKGNRHEPS